MHQFRLVLKLTISPRIGTRQDTVTCLPAHNSYKLHHRAVTVTQSSQEWFPCWLVFNWTVISQWHITVLPHSFNIKWLTSSFLCWCSLTLRVLGGVTHTDHLPNEQLFYLWVHSQAQPATAHHNGSDMLSPSPAPTCLLSILFCDWN